MTDNLHLRLFDAHNHVQDERFAGCAAKCIQAALDAGVSRMVVNGSCEADWKNVRDLANIFPQIIPSYGYHPWYVHEASDQWMEALKFYLQEPRSCIGEIGLDRWIASPDLPSQENKFRAQLQLAAHLEKPVSIHCLKAWGWMLEVLKSETRVSKGFLLHSYGGPIEMIPSFAELGAYFSFPGYYLHDRKTRQRETFKHVPLDRLLAETDAPDQCLPDTRNSFPLKDESGKSINHPANLRAVYEGLAEIRQTTLEELAAQLEQNFERLFGV